MSQCLLFIIRSYIIYCSYFICHLYRKLNLQKKIYKKNFASSLLAKIISKNEKKIQKPFASGLLAKTIRKKFKKN
jgi:hypothetical protein